MPIYEYKCDEGHTFDVVQGFSDEPLASCTKCSAPARRVLSAPAIHFKGSGFYTTDYGSKAKTAASEGSTDSTSSGSDGDSASSNGSGDSSKSSGDGSKGSGDSSKGSSDSSSGDSAKTPA